MKVQVFKAHNININGFGGAAIYHKDFPDRAFIFINMDLSPEEQQRTLRHELWHVLSGDVLHKDDPDGKREAAARRHEDDITLDRIIADARLWENAVIADWKKPGELQIPRGV